MKSLVLYFGCGRYISRDNGKYGEFRVTKFSDITDNNSIF